MSAMRLNGEILIACNCDWGCPCNFNAPPTHGECEGGWIWSVEDGSVDGVDLGGLSFALFADWPGAIHDGGGRADAYFDERASDAQRAALTRVVRGEVGGPWGIFINTYALSEPRAARFEFDGAGHERRLAIGDVVELELQPIRNPVSGAAAHPEMVLPEGLVVKRGSLAASKVFRVSGDIAYDHSGDYAAFGHFSYEG